MRSTVPTREAADALSRRDFLAGAATCAGSLALAGVGAQPARGAAASPEHDLTWLPAWRLRELIASRQVSPVEVIEHFLARIEKLDGRLGSFVVVAADEARAAARAAEAAVARGGELGPLHGVPVSVKAMVQARGLPLEDGRVPTRDYVTSERIRRAGGIILGNTSIAGPSVPGGPADVGASNPWDLTRVAGASSSGAAASVAAGLGPVAIGSDGGGSTRLPAAFCGLIGLHPTVGRVPAHHDLWRSVSRTGWSGTFGPICRDARDAALVLSVIAGPDWRHLMSFNGPAPDYTSELDGGVRGMRMAWTSDFGSGSQYFPEESEAVLAAVRRAAEGFTELGASVEEPAFTLGDWWPIFRGIGGGFAALRSANAQPAASESLEAALDARQEMAEQLLRLFERYDVLLCPTAPRVAPTRDEFARWMATRSFPQEYTCVTGHLNLLGFPALSVPGGFVDGMPVGLQIVARPDEDAKLLRVASAFLRAFPNRERPAFAS